MENEKFYEKYIEIRIKLEKMLTNRCNECYSAMLNAMTDILAQELDNKAIEWIKDSVKTKKELDEKEKIEA